VTEREQRLMGLLRRVLCHSEDLQAQNQRLLELLHQLAGKHRALRGQFASEFSGQAVEAATAEVLLGAAMDELLAHRNQGTP
jgi:hypothetical protein